MKRIATVSLVLLLSSFAGAVFADDSSSGPGVLLAADRAFGRAAAEHGLEGWLSFFAADAAIFPPSRAIVTGIEAIRSYYASTGFTPAGLSWEPEAADLASSGDLGYTYGTWTFEGPGHDGQTRKATGKYLTVWRRQADGSWKVAADMGSNDSPPKPE